MKPDKVHQKKWWGFGAAAVLFVSATANMASAQEAKIPEVLTNDGRFNTLLTAVGAAGLVDTLNSDGPFTLLAPTDAAFEKLPEGTVTALLNDLDTLTDILLYHVIPGSVPAATVVTLDRAQTVQGKSVIIEVNGDMVMINQAIVEETDLAAANGIIHVIDAVLLPPGKIPTVLEERGDFTTLLTAVGAAGLAETLSGDGPFTLLAPTDQAFNNLPAGTVEALLNDLPELAQVLLYHVIDGEVPAETVVTLDKATTIQGNSVTISVNGNMVMINGALVEITDIEAENGIIHVIDTVLLPPGNIPQVLEELGNFDLLLTAVGAAQLGEALSGPGPITLFAPTDEAINALGMETLNALLADPDELAKILLYHVVPGNVPAADVVNSDKLLTALGKRVAVSVNGEMVMINSATVESTDNEARNGVIHVIDTVLLPPGDLPTELTEDGRFSTLLTAVGVAGLGETLSGEGPFTVFAPTDAAFDDLPNGVLDSLINDPEALAQVLLYHVVPGELLSDQVVGLEAAKTASGQSFRITVGETVMINSANIEDLDIEAINGVIHVIDAVILPSQVAQFNAPTVEGDSITLTWGGGNPPYTLQKKNLQPGSGWVDVLSDTTETSTTVPTSATPEVFRVLETPAANN